MIKLRTHWPVPNKTKDEIELLEYAHTTAILDRYIDAKMAKVMHDDWVMCGRMRDHDWNDTIRIAFLKAASGLHGDDRKVKPTVIFEEVNP